MQRSKGINDSIIYYRLVTLWVLCEAMLGGIIHGLRLPVSGLFVGSCAVICICLIAYYVPSRGAILKATIIVAVFKMMLSPQAPLPAYFAVLFQGLMGELLFLNRRFYKLSCLLLAITALIESALQRIIVLTIVYGNELWVAINQFMNGITTQKNATNYSLWIGIVYLALHIIAGLLAGLWAAALPSQIRQWNERNPQYRIFSSGGSEFDIPNKKPRQRLKKGLFIVWIILVLLYVQSYYGFGTPLLPSGISLKIFIRSVIIILTWVFILSPLLRVMLHKWLEKKRSGSQRDIQQVLALLPSTQQLIQRSWELSGVNKGWRRILLCSKIVLGNMVSGNRRIGDLLTKSKITILTGPIGSGKTSSLVNWSSARTDVHGILTPSVDGTRLFMNAQTKEQFHMEVEYGESASSIMIGRFMFSREAFSKAIRIIRNSISKPGWLVIDEIGPLELRDEGFAGVLREVLEGAGNDQKILLVVREGLVEKVCEYFGLENVEVVGTEERLNGG
jgi:nucleoside-triphosphatase THEP1